MNPKLKPASVIDLDQARPPRAGVVSLDVLRFLAASFILLFHFGTSAPISLSNFLPIMSQGWLATDFFLMLSGFVLTRAYAEVIAASKLSPTRFMLRRFFRLWPSHMVVLLAFLAFVLVAQCLGFLPNHAEKYTVSGFVTQAFLIHGWGLQAIPGWNVPTWSLSALIICYGAFSLLAPILVRLTRLQLWIGVACLGLLIYLLGLWLRPHAFVDLPFQWGLLRALPLFALGALIERLAKGWVLVPKAFVLGLCFSLAAISWALMDGRSALHDLLILFALGWAIAVSSAVTFAQSPLTKAMGRASYSLFLVHSLIGAIGFGGLSLMTTHYALSPISQWLGFGAVVLAALLSAFVFDLWVDKPLSQWVKQRLRL